MAVFEAYAQNRTPGAYRVFWCCGPGLKQITILAITPIPRRAATADQRLGLAAQAVGFDTLGLG